MAKHDANCRNPIRARPLARRKGLSRRSAMMRCRDRGANSVYGLTGIKINETGSEINERPVLLEALQKPAPAEDLVGNTLSTQRVPDGRNVDRDHGLS